MNKNIRSRLLKVSKMLKTSEIKKSTFNEELLSYSYNEDTAIIRPTIKYIVVMFDGNMTKKLNIIAPKGSKHDQDKYVANEANIEAGKWLNEIKGKLKGEKLSASISLHDGSNKIVNYKVLLGRNGKVKFIPNTVDITKW